MPTMQALFTVLNPDNCFFVTVYPCKEADCQDKRRDCNHPVSRFQSTRNSKRHVHAHLFYKLAKGVDAQVR